MIEVIKNAKAELIRANQESIAPLLDKLFKTIQICSH